MSKETFIGSVNSAGTHRIEDMERFNAFKHANAGEMLIITYERVDDMKGKERLFAYYNGVLLPWATKTFRKYGWEYDDASTEGELMGRFGRTVHINTETGAESVVVTSKSRWTKKRLSDFIDDVILFFATELAEEAPDAVAYIADLEKQKTYKNLALLNRSRNDF